MKATEASLLQFLKKSPQLTIPIYQRTYSWQELECRQLWEDIVRAGGNDEATAHFVGSVVYIETGNFQVMDESPLLVIDGQQRLTTVTILLEALARHLGETEPIDGFSAEKIRTYYLLNVLERGERGFKLLLTQTDKESLLALVQQKDFPADCSVRVAENFTFFEKQLKALGPDIGVLCKGLSKLMIVDVALNRAQDDPQLIFESMNSTGRELSQADLIRNYVLMGLEPTSQTRLYEDHWRPMEVQFGQEAYGEHFDSFIRHYLTLKTGEIPNIRAVYQAFKTYWRQPNVSNQGVESLVVDLQRFASYYCAIALDKESENQLSEVFRDLRELKVDVAFPLLLELYSDYQTETLSKDDFLKALRLIESYVFRRAVVGVPTNSMNKTFASLRRSLKKDAYFESICAAFLLLPSYRRFPIDEEFRRELAARDLYHFPRRSYWLRRMENNNRKERVSVGEYTIEHIMPQNENLSHEWRESLGPDWQRVQETKLHTLGNLTLTGYNSEYSDRPFLEKRDMAGGFGQSPLRLNAGLGSVDIWDEAAIETRAHALAGEAAAVWGMPQLSSSVLDSYRVAKPSSRSSYSLDDHPFLATGTSTRELFEAVRKDILAIDPCISEEILKLYVAYKAETNFVDIVPQAGGLRISLNMKFTELSDPRRLAKDVSSIGRWGNGEVEIRVDAESQIAYAIGLARQSFESQMGSESTSG